MVKLYYIRSVHQVKKKNISAQMFYKIVALEIFTKFTERYLYWGHF